MLPKDDSFRTEQPEPFFRGYSISPQGADYLICVMGFLDKYRTYPKLAELAKLLRTHVSAISRIERNLRKQGLLRGTRSTGRLQIASHTQLNPMLANMLLLAATLFEERGFRFWAKEELLRVFDELFMTNVDKRTEIRVVGTWLDELAQKGYLVQKSETIGVNWERWGKEKLLLARLAAMESEGFLLPPQYMFADEDVQIRLFRCECSVNAQAIYKEHEVAHAGSDKLKEIVLIPKVAYAVVLQERESGLWQLRVSLESDEPQQLGSRLVRLLKDSQEIVKGWTDEQGVLLYYPLPQDVVDSLRTGVTVEVESREEASG